MASKLVGRNTRRFLGVSLGLGVGGLFMYKSAADLFPHQICKDVKGLKDNEGLDVAVPERCRTQFNEVLGKFGFEHTDNITLFVNKNFNAISAGSILSPSGAVLGLPRWYLYETQEDVANSGLKFNGRDIDWDSELGSTIKECLLPTEDMIAFTIGHELAHIQRVNYKLLESFTAPLWLYLTFRLTNVTQKFFKLQPLLNLMLNLFFCGVSFFLYSLVNQKLSHESEFDADQLSAKCDPRMCQGGVDFFVKRQKLNLTLRKLHGKEGQEHFTEEGNESESYAHPPLSHRLARMKDILYSSVSKDFKGN